MSWKLHTAYRLRRGFDPWETFRELRIKGEAACRDVLRKSTAAFLERNAERCSEDVKLIRRKWLDKDATFDLKRTTAMDVSAAQYREFRDAQARRANMPWGMDVSLVIHHYKGRFYLRPISNGIMYRVLAFLDRHPALEDFHYQNQSDPPRNIPTRQYKARGRVWKAIAAESGVANEKSLWHDALVLEILTPNNFTRVCPAWFDLHREAAKSVKKMIAKR